MGKEREGKIQPATGKDEGAGLDVPVKSNIEQYLELADKYTEGADEVPANVKVRHPNRNINKGEDKKDGKSPGKSSYKTKNETSGEGGNPVVGEELPGVLTKELFADLANFKGDNCISIYLPTHKAGMEVNENADNLAFKNMLQQVTSQLKQKSIDQTVLQKITEPGHELLRNDGFWKSSNSGLAVFMAEGFFKYVKMPDTPKEEIMINSTFMLKPLVNAMTVKEYFFLLVISKKQVKFFKVNAFGMTQIELDELPNGISDVVHLEEKEDQKLFRSESGQAGKGAAFHGHGAGKPDEKENLGIYLEEVDETLWEEILGRENAPLLLSGVEYILPIYKSVSHYKNIWPEVLKGSHEHDDLKSLFTQARTIMEPYFQERTKKALAMYGNQSATALTSSIPADVIPAAHYSRIWHLFVRKDEHIWGTFNEMENILNLHDTKEDGDECLIDKAVIKTILNGGDVHFVSKEDMPADSAIAALMRY